MHVQDVMHVHVYASPVAHHSCDTYLLYNKCDCIYIQSQIVRAPIIIQMCLQIWHIDIAQQPKSWAIWQTWCCELLVQLYSVSGHSGTCSLSIYGPLSHTTSCICGLHKLSLHHPSNNNHNIIGKFWLAVIVSIYVLPWRQSFMAVEELWLSCMLIVCSQADRMAGTVDLFFLSFNRSNINESIIHKQSDCWNLAWCVEAVKCKFFQSMTAIHCLHDAWLYFQEAEATNVRNGSAIDSNRDEASSFSICINDLTLPFVDA